MGEHACRTALRLLVIRTTHIDAVRKFYESIGISFREERHGNGPVHFAADLGVLVFEVYPMKDPNGAVDTYTRLGFTVSNVDEAVAVIRAAGVGIVREPGVTAWGYSAVVRDPDGRTVELSCLKS